MMPSSFITIIILLFDIFESSFPPALTDGFPLKYERPQISSSLRESFKYTGRSQ